MDLFAGLGRPRHRGNPDITNTYLYYKKARVLIQQVLLQVTQGVSREEFSSTKTEIVKHAKALSGGNEMVGRAAAYMVPIKELVKYFDLTDADHFLSDLHSRIDRWVKIFCFYLWLASQQLVTYKLRNNDDITNPEGSDMENADDGYNPTDAGDMYGYDRVTPEQRTEFQRKHAFFFHTTTLKLYFINRAIARAESRAIDGDISEAIMGDIEIFNSIAQLATEYFFEHDTAFTPGAEPTGHPIMLRIFFRLNTESGSIFMCPFPSPINPIPLWPMVASEILAAMQDNTPTSVHQVLSLLDILDSSSPAFSPTPQATLVFTFMSRFARTYKLLEAITAKATTIEPSSPLGQCEPFQVFTFSAADTIKTAKTLKSLLYTPP